MVQFAASFELTNAQMDALQFEAKEEGLSVEELIAWIIRQNIVALLEVIETDNEGRRRELMNALRKEG